MEGRAEEKMKEEEGAATERSGGDEEEDESQAATERSGGDEEDTVVDGVDDDNDEDDEEEEDKDGLGDDDDNDGEEDEEEDKGEDGLDDDDDGLDDDGDDDDDGGDDDEDDEGAPRKRARLYGAAGQKGASDGKSIPGIVYIGHIPPRLRPRDMRNMLSLYGEIGRVFLQPQNRFVKKMKQRKKTDMKRCSFTEGWVEFRDKRLAKRVASTLHNTPMSGKKHSRFHADLWCIKYLHRFHWTHLHERLAYERTVLKQRLRTEISQAKKETNFYLSNVEKSQNMDHYRKKRQKRGEQVEEKQWEFTQRQTEEEIQLKKMKHKNSISQKQLAKGQDKARLIQEKSQSNVGLLAKIFNASKT